MGGHHGQETAQDHVMTAREHMINTLLDTGVDEAAVDCAAGDGRPPGHADGADGGQKGSVTGLATASACDRNTGLLWRIDSRRGGQAALTLVEEGHSYEEAGVRLGVPPGLAYLTATGVPADSSDGLWQPVPRVYLPVSLTAPGPSSSTGPTRLCRGCSHPPRRPPAQAASSFTPPLRRRGDGRSFTSIRNNSGSWRTHIRATTLGTTAAIGSHSKTPQTTSELGTSSRDQP